MSKTKKYLLISASILLLLSGAATAYFAVIGLFDPTSVNQFANQLSTWEMFRATTVTQLIKYTQWGVAALASSTLIAFGFGLMALRYAFYSSQEYFIKRSIMYTMAILSVIVVNPIAGILFIVAAYFRDKNLVIEDEDLTVDILQDKLIKLNSLKEKGLISDAEYESLRASLLK